MILCAISTLYLLVLAVSAWSGRLPLWVLPVCLAASAAAFVAYLADKTAAKSGSRRIPEQTLHLLALLGGWPGALLAQRLLRHKTSKVSFQVVFWLTVAAHCFGFFWLFRQGVSSVPHSPL